MKSTCPYCKSSNYIELYSTYDIFDNTYQIVTCEECKSVFLTPNPSDELLAQAYADSYYGGSDDEEKFEGFIEKGLNFFRKQRARKVVDLVRNSGRVLDIGCGNGQFLELLKSFGDVEIFGTEMQGSSAQRASKIEGLNLKIGELSGGDYEKEYFDVVTMFHVFEHLKNPNQYLDIIDDILIKNGHLVVSFPNIDSWQSRFFKGKWLHLDPPRHLFFFSPKVFKELMTKRGYQLIEENYFSIEQNPFGTIQSWLNIFHKKRELLFESLKGNLEYCKNTNPVILKLEKLLFIGLTPLFILIDLLASVFRKGATVEFIFKKKA